MKLGTCLLGNPSTGKKGAFNAGLKGHMKCNLVVMGSMGAQEPGKHDECSPGSG